MVHNLTGPANNCGFEAPEADEGKQRCPQQKSQWVKRLTGPMLMLHDAVPILQMRRQRHTE